MHSAFKRTTPAMALALLLGLSGCNSKDSKSDSGSGDATADTSTDTSTSTNTSTSTDSTTVNPVGSLIVTHPTLPYNIATANYTSGRILLLASGGCSATYTAASNASWQSHPTWLYLHSSTFAAFKAANSTLFSPLSNVLGSASEVCVISNTEVTFQAGSTSTISNLPTGTFAAIFAVDDELKNVVSAAMATVTVVADTSTDLSMTMQDIAIDTSSVGGGGGGDLPVGTGLSFLAGAPVVRVGVCTPLLVGLEDSLGASVTSTYNVTLSTLTSSISGQFYADASCLTASSAASIPAYSSSTMLYYRDTSYGSPTLTISDTSGAVSDAAQVATIVSSTTPQLVFAQSLLTQGVDVCGAVTVSLKTASGTTPASSQQPLSLQLSSSTATGYFYRDTSCLVRIDSTTVSSPYYSTTVYFKDSADGKPALLASTGNSLATPASLVATIGTGTPNTTPPTSTLNLRFSGAAQPSTNMSGCYVMSLELVDAYGSPSYATATTLVNFSSNSSSGSFYAGSTCSQRITSTYFMTGTSQLYVSYSDLSAGSWSISAYSTGIQSAFTTVTTSTSGGSLEEPLFDFGGMFGRSVSSTGATTINVNPATGAASCPTGYSHLQVYGSSSTVTIDHPVYMCWREHKRGINSAVDFGGFFTRNAAGSVIATNPITGSGSCPAGYTASVVVGSPNVDNTLVVCQRAHVSGGQSWPFGGLYGQGVISGVSKTYTNILGLKSCPIGYQSKQIMGSSSPVDYALSFCYQN